MCGITGIFNLNGEPVSPVVLRRMTDAIAHRGPDGEGFYTDSFVGLGHRRLAIIDLSPAGHQPMITADGQYVLTYNGEIYNFQELRLELEALGYQFRSRTDSEVVLYAYAQWGAIAWSASTACLPLPSGIAPGSRFSWPATAMGSSRSTTLAGIRHLYSDLSRRLS